MEDHVSLTFFHKLPKADYTDACMREREENEKSRSRGMDGVHVALLLLLLAEQQLWR